MRIGLYLDYVLRRTCDHGRPWVAWCPQLGIVKDGRGSGPASALMGCRQAVRSKVETALLLGAHPKRMFVEPDPSDPDLPAYREFKGRFDDGPESDEGFCESDLWTRAYGEKYLPDHVDTAFAHISMSIETNAGRFLIHDDWYNELWYRSDGMVDVVCLVEMTFKVDKASAESDPLGYIHRHYGHSAKIVEIRPHDPRRGRP